MSVIKSILPAPPSNPGAGGNPTTSTNLSPQDWVKRGFVLLRDVNPREFFDCVVEVR